MSAVITRDYQGHTISYQADGWFNATAAAAKWGKAPAEWLRLPSTIEYIGAVVKHNPSMGKTHRSKSGPAASGGGTWLHPKLAVPFSRWLDAEFAVWCDAQIDSLIRGKDDWRLSRHASASGYKLASDILKMVRDEAGQPTESHHYKHFGVKNFAQRCRRQVGHRGRCHQEGRQPRFTNHQRRARIASVRAGALL